jgi:hypothetical protein
VDNNEKGMADTDETAALWKYKLMSAMFLNDVCTVSIEVSEYI